MSDDEDGIGVPRPAKEGTWRERLRTAFEVNGRSLREISLEAGLAHSYLHSVLVNGNEPTIAISLPSAAFWGVSVGYVVDGYDTSPGKQTLEQTGESDC
jgi:hypothetical protein